MASRHHDVGDNITDGQGVSRQTWKNTTRVNTNYASDFDSAFDSAFEFGSLRSHVAMSCGPYLFLQIAITSREAS